MKLCFSLILAGLISGCATQRAHYGSSKNGFSGYTEKNFEDGLVVTRFQGSDSTPSEDAYNLSIVRANEVCTDQKKATSIVSTKETSTSTTVFYMNSYSTPLFNGALTSGSGSSKTSVYPSFDTYFACQDRIYSLKIKFAERSTEEMKSITNDLLPGLQVTKIDADSPNANSLQVGDIIIKVNGVRATNSTIAAWTLQKTSKENMVTVVRDGQRFDVKIRAIDVTKADIAAQMKLIAMVCKTRQAWMRGQPMCNPGWGSSID